MEADEEARLQQVIWAHASAQMPSLRERDLLYALDAAARALAGYNEELRLEVGRRAEERRAVGQLPLGREGRHLRQPLALKSESQRVLERGKRDAKSACMACINALALGRMYSETQICRVAAADGSIDRAGLFRPAQRAIAQADVAEALSWVHNDYARKAFWLRHKWGLDNDRASELLGCQPADVNRLVNIALDAASARLNTPVVAEVRARFFNFCMAQGLEFPEYELLRRREGKA